MLCYRPFSYTTGLRALCTRSVCWPRQQPVCLSLQPILTDIPVCWPRQQPVCLSLQPILTDLPVFCPRQRPVCLFPLGPQAAGSGGYADTHHRTGPHTPVSSTVAVQCCHTLNNSSNWLVPLRTGLHLGHQNTRWKFGHNSLHYVNIACYLYRKDIA